MAPTDRDTFLGLSAFLTGFDVTTLEGTGVVDQYLALLQRAAGFPATAAFLASARALLDAPEAERDRRLRVELWASPVLGPLVINLITLWYVGQWNALPHDWYAVQGLPPNPADVTQIPSPAAYGEALVWRVAGAHAPGSNPGGHGSWSLPPVIAEDPA
jgi:hypothetical protein